MHWELSATKIAPEFCRGIKYKAAVDDELPALLERSLFAHKFEVVDVDAQDELEPLVEEKAPQPWTGSTSLFISFSMK